MLKRWLHQPIYLLIASCLAFGLLGLSAYNDHQRDPIAETAESLSDYLVSAEQSFDQVATGVIAEHPNFSDSEPIQFEILYNLNYQLFVYHHDSLIFWNGNQANIPEVYRENLVEDAMIRLQNGHYYVKQIQSDDLQIIGLIPLKWAFRLENTYLKSELALPNSPKDLRIELTELETDYPVVNVQDETVCYLESGAYSIHNRTNGVTLFLLFVSWILFWFTLHVTARKLLEEGKTLITIVVVIFGGIAVRAIMFLLGHWTHLNNWELFSPELNSASYFYPSLGDLLLNLIILGWVVFFLLVKVRIRLPKRNHRLFLPLVLTFVHLSALLICLMVKSLILDSVISFDVTNFLSLDQFSLIGMVELLISLLIYVVICMYLLPRKGRYLGKVFIVTQVSFLAISTITLLLVNANSIWLFVVFWSVVFTSMVYSKLFGQSKRPGYAGSVLMVAMFALFSAVLIHQFNLEKDNQEMDLVVETLLQDRDFYAENTFGQRSEEIQQDAFLVTYLSGSLLSKASVENRIRELYLADFSTAYEIQLEVFPTYGDASSLTEQLNGSLIWDQGEVREGLVEGLRYRRDPVGTAYQGQIWCLNGTDTTGLVLANLVPKLPNVSTIYPELLLEGGQANEIPEKFEYAIYQGGNLVMSDGSNSFSLSDPWMISVYGESGTRTVYQENATLKMAHDEMGRTVVLRRVAKSSWLVITEFSYIFCFYLLFVTLILLSAYAYNFLRWQRHPGLKLNMTFRDRINFSMIAIIILSFSIIGGVTIRYFSNEYDDYHEQRLVRKQRAVLAALEHYLFDSYSGDTTGVLQLTSNNRALRDEVASLSDIHAMDINIYGLDGRLVGTSQSGIFSKGLIADRMDAMAYYQMAIQQGTSFMHKEQIGGLSFLSIYVPIRDEHVTLGYLNMPYFAQVKNLNQDISSFMVALVNIYVFLLVGAGLIAFAISNSITQSIRRVGEKLRLVNLERRNEPIPWENDDEIGLLVREYNKMIIELDNSVDLLARSERESAWREMAKQIAHEIKNPLTPMRLSIQHLQRAMADDRDDIKPLTERVSKTLMEQIDNLSEIATAFSSFAKMPTAAKEVVELGGLLEGVVDLFKEEPNVGISYNNEVGEATIYADKNQMISVFNNLVKNAVQAVPDGQEGYIEVQLTRGEKDGELLVAIEDNGVGIKDEDSAAVFVPNFTTKSSGTGLGLAISRQIIENSDGRIWFKSVYGEGTTFYVAIKHHKPGDHDE